MYVDFVKHFVIFQDFPNLLFVWTFWSKVQSLSDLSQLSLLVLMVVHFLSPEINTIPH